MMTRSLAFVVLFVSCLAVVQARAVEDRKAITYNETERGFFVDVSGGF